MLLKLLSAPITLPIKAILKVVDEAKAKYYDPKAIIVEYEDLKRRHEEGEINGKDYITEKRKLNERLEESRLFIQKKG